ncbi:MAG TPA: hypothetical protein VK968_18245 [Roseimicrobium sp.]|nr:hypothetical protein [Roseimicrobium sp.]
MWNTANTPQRPNSLRLGQLVATPGAIHAMAAAGQDPAELLARHRSGDWGEVPPEDWQANNDALLVGNRVLSAYLLKDGTRLWVITEADRSVTTILLPDEY